MSTGGDQELMAQISQLAGRINRHKNQQLGLTAQQSYHYAPYTRPTYNYTRGRGGATAGGRTHRSLALVTGQNRGFSGDTLDVSNTWVSNTFPNRQLIGNAAYEKGNQARSRAIEDTRRQRQERGDDPERAKFIHHIHRMANGGGGAARANSQSANKTYEVVVDGMRFIVAKNGSKLVKAADDGSSAKATPRMAVVGGVRFYRSKNGNLYRHGIVKAQRRRAPMLKVNVPCQTFSTTGSCTKGPHCRYKHDPTTVSACKEFLLKGNCFSGDACDLSHELTAERTLHCVHFAKDSCTKPDCRYAHVKVSPGAPVCHSFGRYGYCEKGAQCTDRHVWECPNFSNTGICEIRGCKLLHRERASVLRKASAITSKVEGDNTDVEDLSTDEEGDSVDENDVDSDEVDEFIGQDDSSDFDMSQEYDYIGF